MQDGFRLITLGRLALLAPGGREDPSLAARRLKLVLLVMLASARRPISRDTLLGLFWPDQDEARARHSLSDALSHLRRVLGPSAISTRQAEVELNPSAEIAIDAAHFVMGIESADAKIFERALALYEGPFLAGVNVSASQQLEDWITRERSRLEALFVRACERRCAELARGNQWDECGELAARWLDAVPLSTDAAVYRLDSLNAAGTRDSAQRTYTEYRRLVAKLRAEYGRGPDAKVVAIAKGLRATLGGVDAEAAEVELPATVSEPAAEPMAAAPVAVVAPIATGPSAAPSKPDIPGELTASFTDSHPAAPHRGTPRLLWYALAAGVALFIATGLGRMNARRERLGAAADSLEVAHLVASTSIDTSAAGSPRVLVADLQNHTRDSLLAGAITEALRVDLEQSRRVQMLSSTQVRDALQRMERPPGAPLSDSVTRELAQRDGAKAVISGDVGELGTAYTISMHLVSAQTGDVIDAFRETAKDSTQILDAVDRLSRSLRARLGDGLALIESTPPLEQVTTTSLAALRAYSQGMRAAERDGDANKSIALLEEAVALDPHFAMAYRKLAAELDLLGYARHAKAMEASKAAFDNRDHLSDRERYYTMALYNQNTGDPEKTAAAYRAVLGQYPRDVRALNNLGSVYMQLKDYRSAAELRARAVAVDSTVPDIYNALAQALFSEGNFDETARVVATMRRRFPNYAPALWTEVSLTAAQGDFSAAELMAKSALTAAGTDYDNRAEALRLESALALVQGHLGEVDRVTTQLVELIQQKGQPSDYLEQAGYRAFVSTWYRHDSAQAIRLLDAAIAKYPLVKMEAQERHADWLAYNYAIAGKPAKGRATLAEFYATHPVLSIGDRGQYERAEGALEIAEHRYADAQATLRKAQDEYWCPTCTLPDLARAYEAYGERDSAIAVYARYVDTPWVWWLQSDGEYHATTFSRLGALYEAKGDSAHAIASYRKAIAFWATADAELQPQVTIMKARLQALGAR